MSLQCARCFQSVATLVPVIGEAWDGSPGLFCFGCVQNVAEEAGGRVPVGRYGGLKAKYGVISDGRRWVEENHEEGRR